MSIHGLGITAVKVYFPQDGPIQVHQTRVILCTSEFSAGFYWYGGKRSGPKRPPKLVRNNNQVDIDVQPNEANGCQENTDNGYICMKDNSLCGSSNSTTDCKDILPDPWQTGTPYGL